jgi:hypothetical protein
VRIPAQEAHMGETGGEIKNEELRIKNEEIKKGPSK